MPSFVFPWIANTARIPREYLKHSRRRERQDFGSSYSLAPPAPLLRAASMRSMRCDGPQRGRVRGFTWMQPTAPQLLSADDCVVGLKVLARRTLSRLILTR